MSEFRDLRSVYRALTMRLDAQLAETCPELREATRIGFAVQIADATLRNRRGEPSRNHLYEIGGSSN